MNCLEDAKLMGGVSGISPREISYVTDDVLQDGGACASYLTAPCYLPHTYLCNVTCWRPFSAHHSAIQQHAPRHGVDQNTTAFSAHAHFFLHLASWHYICTIGK